MLAHTYVYMDANVKGLDKAQPTLYTTEPKQLE